MLLQPRPTITPPHLVSPLLAAGVAILLLGLLREPARQKLSAILLAGAGAAYFAGGLGPWEFVFCAAISALAYLGLGNYRWIGLGWLLHAGWDVVHHLYGNPIIPVLPLSSFGCGICDVALAAWYVAGAPSPYPWLRPSSRLAVD